MREPGSGHDNGSACQEPRVAAVGEYRLKEHRPQLALGRPALNISWCPLTPKASVESRSAFLWEQSCLHTHDSCLLHDGVTATHSAEAAAATGTQPAGNVVATRAITQARRRDVDRCPPHTSCPPSNKGPRASHWHRVTSARRPGPLKVVSWCDTVEGVAFSPDGTRLAVVSLDKTVQIIDVSRAKAA